MEAEGVANVAPVLGSEASPGLPPQSTDLTLIVDAYHEFSRPLEMLRAVYRATRPGGRLALVEYRAEDPTVPIKPLHKMTEAQAGAGGRGRRLAVRREPRRAPPAAPAHLRAAGGVTPHSHHLTIPVRNVLAVLAVAAAPVASAQTGSRSTALFADALGPTGAYALGVEQAVLASATGERQLRLRAGVSYWTEDFFFNSPTDRVLTVPLGAAALFSLGRPLGIPAAFEFGGGAVIVRRESERYRSGNSPVGSLSGTLLTAPAYGEVAVRASFGSRVGLRAGVAVGGEESELVGDGARPVFGIGVGL